MFGKMVRVIKVNMLMIRRMDMVYLLGLVVNDMKDIGKMANNTEMVL